ncbi:hypothetical protein ACFUGD_06695 [Streptomyces sp. NPDC057217]|uniref:phage distal tail protein n=1 Tax=Streptomyces sp. NPDC057217 TaxID=3346054 RepID=UPI0036424834
MGTQTLGELITGPGQVQYGDLLLGAGTSYRWRTLTGWEDLPDLDSSNAARPDSHGAYPGALLAQTRTVGLDGITIRAPRDQIGGAVAQFNAGTVPRLDEIPLVAWLDERGPLLVHARVLRRRVPTTVGYQLGVISGAALQWEATDPRRYGVDEQSADTGLPAPEPGLDWSGGGLSWADGLDWGLGGLTGNVGAVNSGDAETSPVITFSGPVTMPRLTQEDGRTIEYDITLAADDRLVVDTREGTVTLNGSASRLYTATTRSVPEAAFTLAPGTTSLAFRAETHSAAAHCTVQWRSAYW